jgi:RIO-like serine/threonine protein kinase
MTKNLSGNSISRVWRDGDWIYKRQPKYLADNEFYGLRVCEYAPPAVTRIDKETVRMWFIESEPVTNPKEFMLHYRAVLASLQQAGLRHGDLTEYSVLVKDNRPVIIDWAESRTWDDPRPDKRRQGDAYWLKKTMEKLCQNET